MDSSKQSARIVLAPKAKDARLAAVHPVQALDAVQGLQIDMERPARSFEVRTGR